MKKQKQRKKKAQTKSKRKSKTYITKNKQKKTQTTKKTTMRITLSTSFENCFLFTDLSAVGPPAKLKHITQRRKRKQP